MKPCPRPIDAVDAEAIAAGADPALAPDAASHALECSSCGALVLSSRQLGQALEGLSEAAMAVPGLAARVTRLRAFSRKERRTYALWKAPVLLDLGLAALGLALVTFPIALTATEQLTAGAVALSPLLGLARSISRSVLELARLAPAGLEALSDGMRGQSVIGLAALALLAPVALGLRRVLARVPGRK